MVRPNRLFKLVDEGCDGNSFAFLVENPVESTPYFAEGFHQAGRVLVANLKAEETWPDYQAVPVVFLYRHAVELALKGIVWNGDQIAKNAGKTLSGASEQLKAKHGLIAILMCVENVKTEFGLRWPSETIPWSEAMALIEELDAVDPGSFAFRYPMRRDGAPSQSTEFGFNVYDFATLLDPVLDGLRSLAYELEDHRESTWQPL